MQRWLANLNNVHRPSNTQAHNIYKGLYHYSSEASSAHLVVM